MQSLFYRLLAVVLGCAALVFFAVYLKRASRDVHSQLVDDWKASASKAGMPELPDINKIRETAQRNPASPEAQAAFAHALFRHGDYDEALPVFDSAIRLNPADAQLYFERGKIRENTGHRADAIPDFEQAVFLDPKNVPAMLRAATLWHYDRDSSRSIQWCRRVLEIEPNNGEAHRLWALALVQDAEYSRSISEFQAAAAASPKDDSILLEMGLAYKRAGDRRNARETLDAACKMNPRNSRACNEARLTPIN